MENLTHTLTGLMLSRAGLNRLTPYATPILLIAANIPDADIVTGFQGSLAYLDSHRGITHSFLGLPVMALIAVMIVAACTWRKVAWRRHWLGALAAACVGVLSHLLLDWTNVYGIRMLLPFSADWLRLDITNIVDIWIWCLLLLGVTAPLLSRLVSAEIGARPGSGRGMAVAVLLLLGSYEFGRYLLHQRAIAMLESRLYEGAAPTSVLALPDGFNFLRWTGVIRTPGFYVVVPLHLLHEFDPGQGTVYYQTDAAKEVAAARATPTFQRFLQFAQFPLWRVIPAEQPEGGVQVLAIDMRFGAPGEQRFAAVAVLDSSSRVVSSQFSFGPLRSGRRD